MHGSSLECPALACRVSLLGDGVAGKSTLNELPVQIFLQSIMLGSVSCIRGNQETTLNQLDPGVEEGAVGHCKHNVRPREGPWTPAVVMRRRVRACAERAADSPSF